MGRFLKWTFSLDRFDNGADQAAVHILVLAYFLAVVGAALAAQSFFVAFGGFAVFFFACFVCYVERRK